MSQDHVPPTTEPTTETPSASPAAAGSTQSWQRDISQRLSHNATPQELGVYVGSHVPAAQRDQVFAFLHQQRGNAFVQQVIASAAVHGNGALTGPMLVSNNPEGLTSPGTIVTAHAKAGAMAAYIHHSNHTHAPLDMYLVVKPDHGDVTTGVSGASAATGGSKRASGATGDWAADPNVIVAAANEAKGDAKDPNSHNRTNLTKVANGPTPIKIGTLPAAGAGDPPLFDARYDLTLSGDAELEVVAERGGAASASAAAKDGAFAAGNTKYETGGSNGRAAGVYTGANFASDDTAKVSQLPFRKPLTGSKFSSGTPSPKVTEAQSVAAPSTAVLRATADALKTSVDAAAIYVLDHVFRISPDWLREKGVWDGTHLTTKGLSDDYIAIITDIQRALANDRGDTALAATKAAIARHPTVGATLDAASYGTMFEVGVLIDNDTKQPAHLDLQFLTDAGAARSDSKGAVYRGLVSVDGVEHAINSDTAHGLHPSTDLGDATVEPAATKYVHVEFQSPGQVSGGQELDIKKK